MIQRRIYRQLRFHRPNIGQLWSVQLCTAKNRAVRRILAAIGLLSSLFVLAVGCGPLGSDSAQPTQTQSKTKPPLSINKPSIPIISSGTQNVTPALRTASTTTETVDLNQQKVYTPLLVGAVEGSENGAGVSEITIEGTPPDEGFVNSDEDSKLETIDQELADLLSQPMASSLPTLTITASIGISMPTIDIKPQLSNDQSIPTLEANVTLTHSSLLTSTDLTHTHDELFNDLSMDQEKSDNHNGDSENELTEPASISEGEEVATGIRVQRTVNVPILMYHYLSTPPADADIYRLDLSVTPEAFTQHLDSMLDAGYTTISLFDLWKHLENGTDLPKNPVVITFDDGYLDNYDNAFPILLQRGMTATFFIVTDFIEQNRPGYITWSNAQEMFDAGMSLESHGINHFSLENRDEEFLVFQALRSKETISARIGAEPRFISYPAGKYDQKTIDVFRSANYLMGVTTIQGSTHTNDNYFELHRVRIRGTTDTAELLRLLSLDW